MIRLDGSTKLLMYHKESNLKFIELLNTDTSDSDGALYNNIWELVWELATETKR